MSADKQLPLDEQHLFQLVDYIVDRIPYRIAPAVMDMEACAAYTNLSPHTVRFYCRRNIIPYVKLGRHYRFEKDAIDRWIADNRKGR